MQSKIQKAKAIALLLAELVLGFAVLELVTFLMIMAWAYPRA